MLSTAARKGGQKAKGERENGRRGNLSFQKNGCIFVAPYIMDMRIITFKRIKEFSAVHPDAEMPLCRWFRITESNIWSNLNNIRNTFPTADYVGNNRYVFNIKGNDYRLVAIIIFASKKVYIRFIGTHSEYEKIDCKNI
jgi:mRNA interferase HigB